MRKAIWVLALLVLGAKVASAQTATFTWIGDATNGVTLSNIDNQPVNPSTGYSGSIQLTNGSTMWLLDLPEGASDPPAQYNFPSFPNNGYLDCGTLLTFGAKQWITGDGTHAGDSYYLPASTTCPMWNGTVQISITEYREMVAHRYCRYGVCKTSLIDTMESGFGTATVQ